MRLYIVIENSAKHRITAIGNVRTKSDAHPPARELRLESFNTTNVNGH